MKIAMGLLCALALAALVAGPAAAQGQMPRAPKPGPEHAVLKGHEGVWDATMESWEKPGAPPMVSKGVETNTLMGGMWLVTDFKGEFMATPFLGHGVMGYDPGKKKYVSTWVDSLSTGLSLGDGTYDAASRTMTQWLEGPDMSGRMMRMRATSETKDADTRVFTMYAPGPNGKEFPGMRVTYMRRK